MSLEKAQKIKKLLEMWPQGTVATSKDMSALNISAQLAKRYKESGWITPIGHGAYKRHGDNISWQGGLYALQQNKKSDIHVGAVTALGLLGLSHYLRLQDEPVALFSADNVKLPSWFARYGWEQKINHTSSSFLNTELGLMEFETKTFGIKISAAERAILECLYLAPKKMDLVECYHLMEGLGNLRPTLVQHLLERCSSVQVKRLFLYTAHKAGHSWLAFVDTKNISLGSGDRALIKNGVYIPNYKITVPKELATL